MEDARKPRRLGGVHLRVAWLASATMLVTGAHCTPRDPDPQRSALASTPAAAGFDLPLQDTAPEDLAPEGYQHALVLRIRRDFGKRDFEIAMDAWMPDETPERVDAVRLWWFKAHKGGQRGVFSQKSSRNFDVSYQRRDERSWTVALNLSDGRQFTFLVRSTGGHTAAAFANVTLSDGTLVDSCRVTDAEIHARTTFGITTGITDLSVTCVDAGGVEQQGTLTS